MRIGFIQADGKLPHLTLMKLSTFYKSNGCTVEWVEEGKLKQDTKIEDIINPRSNIITLYDNNLTADPECLSKLAEIKERGLRANFSQGFDIRLMTEEIASTMKDNKFYGNLHYSWDLLSFEKQVLRGINILKEYIPAYRHTCYVLCGAGTSFEEDIYRVEKLKDMGIRPYIMKFNMRKDDLKLNHFTRWVNGFIYKKVPFEVYTPFAKLINRGILC